MRALRPIVVLLLLGLVVAPAWASPQGYRPESRSALLDRLGSFLTSLCAAAGCAIDPDGACTLGNRPSAGDEGCAIDPDGLQSKVAALPAGDEGAAIDPAGRCQAASAGDAGCAIDPWGVAGR
jgi:hypothetical protein